MREDPAKRTQTVPRTRFDALRTRSAEVTIRSALLMETSEKGFLMDSVPIASRVSLATAQAG
jgi:hypothetical protein